MSDEKIQQLEKEIKEAKEKYEDPFADDMFNGFIIAGTFIMLFVGLMILCYQMIGKQAFLIISITIASPFVIGLLYATIRKILHLWFKEEDR